MIALDTEKDIWDKLKAISFFAASVLVPFAVAIVGNEYSKAISEANNSIRYTELAIEILKDNSTEGNQNVRDWSVDVINKYSRVEISKATRKELIDTKLFDWAEIGDYNMPMIDKHERAVKFLVRERNENTPVDFDGEYFLSSGTIRYADEDWYEGHSAVGVGPETVILLGTKLKGKYMEIRVSEYDFAGNELVSSNHSSPINNGFAYFVYKTQQHSEELPANK